MDDSLHRSRCLVSNQYTILPDGISHAVRQLDVPHSCTPLNIPTGTCRDKFTVTIMSVEHLMNDTTFTVTDSNAYGRRL